MVGKTKAPTKAEQIRFEELHDLGCIACRIEQAMQLQRTEAHHLLSGGRRRGHAYSIPLCGWHHRGEPPAKWNAKEARVAFGPSLRLESRAFHERYGSDDALLEKIEGML